MIKKLLIASGVVIVLAIAALTVATFVAPTNFAAEREVTINRPKAEVFAYIKLIKNQSVWGPWYKKEPSMKQEFRGTDGEVGFVSYWKGTTDDVGEGEQEITRIVDGERVDTQLRFISPFESKADAYLITEAVGDNQTKVRWGFSGDMPRPMNLFLLVMDINIEVGKDYQEGLENLKTILEKK